MSYQAPTKTLSFLFFCSFLIELFAEFSPFALFKFAETRTPRWCRRINSLQRRRTCAVSTTRGVCFSLLETHHSRRFLVKQQKQPRTNVGQFWWVWCKARWWFQIFFIFTPICRRFPFWLIFFKWVETTNQKEMRLNPEKIDWLADDNVWPKITAFHSQEHASQSELDLPVQSLCKKGNEQRCIWGFPKMGVPQNGWFIIMENLIQMDDLGVPLFSETPILTSDLCCDAFQTFLWGLQKAHCTEFHSSVFGFMSFGLFHLLRRLVAVFRPPSHYKETRNKIFISLPGPCFRPSKKKAPQTPTLLAQPCYSFDVDFLLELLTTIF